MRFVGKDEGVVVGRAPAPTDELGRFMLNGEHVVPMHPAARAAGFMAIDVAAAEAVVVHPPPVGREWFAVIDVDCVPRVEARACGHGQVTARRRSCVRARVQRAGQGQDRGSPRFTRSRSRRTKSCSRAVRSRKLDGRCMLPTCSVARQSSMLASRLVAEAVSSPAKTAKLLLVFDQLLEHALEARPALLQLHTEGDILNERTDPAHD